MSSVLSASSNIQPLYRVLPSGREVLPDPRTFLVRRRELSNDTAELPGLCAFVGDHEDTAFSATGGTYRASWPVPPIEARRLLSFDAVAILEEYDGPVVVGAMEFYISAKSIVRASAKGGELCIYSHQSWRDGRRAAGPVACRQVLYEGVAAVTVMVEAATLRAAWSMSSPRLHAFAHNWSRRGAAPQDVYGNLAVVL